MNNMGEFELKYRKMDKVKEIVLEKISNGENVLIHGPGGVGKSVLLSEITKTLLTMEVNVYCTALTGTASVSLSSNGIKVQTLHSWAGVGLANGKVDELVDKIQTTPAKKRWECTDVLIVDEVSMLGGSLFEKLDSIAKIIRGNDKPFGGMPLILGGDFLQLPPVKDIWIFETQAFEDLKLNYINLVKPKRYTNCDYFDLLLRLRKGNHTKEDIKLLKARQDAYTAYKKQIASVEKEKLFIIPTSLFPRRDSTDEHNLNELNKLDSPMFEYKAVDSIKLRRKIKKKTAIEGDISKYEKVLNELLPQTLKLKKGAQVMLKVNLDVSGGLVNGSRGVVTRIDQRGFDVAFLGGRNVTFSVQGSKSHEDKNYIVTRIQYPFVLAWALTIHACQGCTLDSGVCSLGLNVFADAQAYVCLSRIRDIKGLFLSDFDLRSIKTNPLALEFANEIEENATYNEK